MGAFASGKYAFGLSDRSGFRYRMKDMRKEWNGSLVGNDEYEEKHPSLTPPRVSTDPEALRNARPDNSDDISAFIVYTNVGLGLIGTKMESFEATSSLGSVTVSIT
jgi:hypothetical protein|tara:strand:+ start:1638 stop:1955 length:318 start_codon:yes stop_codon:yes gene_type:complete